MLVQDVEPQARGPPVAVAAARAAAAVRKGALCVG